MTVIEFESAAFYVSWFEISQILTCAGLDVLKAHIREIAVNTLGFIEGTQISQAPKFPPRLHANNPRILPNTSAASASSAAISSRISVMAAAASTAFA